MSELIALKSKFTKGAQSSTTVYIHNPSKNTLQLQLKAISCQTVLPERIVVYLYDVQSATIGADILSQLDISRSLFPEATVQVVTTSKSFSIHGRFQSLLEVMLSFFTATYVLSLVLLLLSSRHFICFQIAIIMDDCVYDAFIAVLHQVRLGDRRGPHTRLLLSAPPAAHHKHPPIHPHHPWGQWVYPARPTPWPNFKHEAQLESSC
jgi:hypothetical protein